MLFIVKFDGVVKKVRNEADVERCCSRVSFSFALFILLSSSFSLSSVIKTSAQSRIQSSVRAPIWCQLNRRCVCAEQQAAELKTATRVSIFGAVNDTTATDHRRDFGQKGSGEPWRSLPPDFRLIPVPY